MFRGKNSEGIKTLVLHRRDVLLLLLLLQLKPTCRGSCFGTALPPFLPPSLPRKITVSCEERRPGPSSSGRRESAHVDIADRRLSQPMRARACDVSAHLFANGMFLTERRRHCFWSRKKKKIS